MTDSGDEHPCFRHPEPIVWTGKDVLGPDSFLAFTEDYCKLVGWKPEEVFHSLLSTEVREKWWLRQQAWAAAQHQPTWEDMKEAFMKMESCAAHLDADMALTALLTSEVSQGSLCAMGYSVKLRQYFRQVPELANCEKLQAKLFTLGLQPELRVECLRGENGKPFDTLSEAVLWAYAQERKLEHKKRIESCNQQAECSRKRKHRGGASRWHKRRMAAGYSEQYYGVPMRHQWTPDGRPICSCCGEVGHKAFECNEYL